VRRSMTGASVTGNKNGVKAGFLAILVLAAAGFVFYFSTTRHAAKAGGPPVAALKALPSTTLSLPLFFEPNQGQTAPPVKFLARGPGFGLFLTADEAVLQLQRSAPGSPLSALRAQPASGSVIRMRLEGADTSARVSGVSPLRGKSNYFIGSDPSQWHRDIPQYARVQYRGVYPGVDLVYYGNQGQLEYDFRVAPGADPSQIVLSFGGAAAHVDTGDAGDLILSTEQGDVHFRAPRVYQPAARGDAESAVAGSFRQLAGNTIGFAIGDYDHNRELVIDPTLSYSTYLGGSGSEGFVQVAVDNAGLIYLAGSTNSTSFPLPASPPANPPLQSSLNPATGAQNIFIAVLDATLQSPTNQNELVYATYLGGSGTDTLAGIAVDSSQSIYVAGTTTSSDFPTNGVNAPFQATPLVAGAHGFLSKIAFPATGTLAYQLSYSTYLSGNGVDTVTGLAIEPGCSSSSCNAYVTGTTTSTNPASDGFPANPNGYQIQSNASAGDLQFFASKISPNGSGTLSMLYSTYFGGGNPPGQIIAAGGGVAADAAQNMYITGTTNMLPVGINGGKGFPLFNAQQSCLNGPSQTSGCNNNPTTVTDGFVAKLNTNQQTGGFGAPPVYSTYIGGSGSDTGAAVAVDTSGNAYVTGSTFSTDWACNCPPVFQTNGYGGGGDAYIVKVGPQNGSMFPLAYFTYLGGSGRDYGTAIQVDSVQAAHVAGTTFSSDLPTANPIQPSSASPYKGNTYGGGGDAFVASISTTMLGTNTSPNGDYVTYLGGSGLDQGTGIALDPFNATYVAGSTQSSQSSSPPFPITASSAYQPQLNGPSDAFVSKLGANSVLTLTNAAGSPLPTPAPAGAAVAFTFDVTNTGPDTASNVTFFASLPSGLTTLATAKVVAGQGSCTTQQGSTISCTFPTIAVNAMGAVEVDVTPPITDNLQQITVSATANANGGPAQGQVSQKVNVVDFTVMAVNTTPVISAGNIATIQVTLCPTPTSITFGGYSGTVTPTSPPTISPSMVTATTPIFNPTTVLLPGGSACGTTTLTIATVPRPITIGSLSRRGWFYAAWLPIAGLSLVGLGRGTSRRRRRWLAGAALCLIASVILFQPACGSSSNTATTTGGTQPGTYTITITGSAGAGESHQANVQLQVN